jgi:hypothetical protein
MSKDFVLEKSLNMVKAEIGDLEKERRSKLW